MLNNILSLLISIKEERKRIYVTSTEGKKKYETEKPAPLIPSLIGFPNDGSAPLLNVPDWPLEAYKNLLVRIGQSAYWTRHTNKTADGFDRFQNTHN